MASSIGNKVNGDVDESLYSRQLYVFGHEAQRKLGSSSVLIMGLNGLGIETAKNIILAGVKSVTLYDNTLTSFEDLSAQFYLSELDIGKPRSLTSSKKLSELNPYVEVIALSEPITTDIVSHHTCVVLVDQPWEILSQISEFCHQKNIPVLTGDVRGVFGSIFCDFGKSFVVHDPTGEEAVTCVIENITQDYPAVVRVLEENRHNLESGDMVTLSGINGMGELNGGQYVVTVLDGYSFTINIDTRLFHPYHSGGYMTQVKQPVTLSFKPLLEAVNDPGMFNIDIMKFDSAPLLHLAWRLVNVYSHDQIFKICFVDVFSHIQYIFTYLYIYLFYLYRTLHKYKESHAGQFPEPGNLTQAQEFFELAMHINNAALTQNIFHVDPKTVSDKATFLKRFALCCRGVISPLCALVGGILGQETLKACSGKFTPLQQFFYFDGIDALSDEPLPMEEVTPVGSRYDGQIMVFGKSIQQKLMSTNAFLVGAGAIGCEMLKNWAMMGISTGMNGRGATYVTDMDQIERSNLSRQFLFRNTNIGHLKSDTAVTAVKSMNPSFQAVAYDQKVGVETEAFFGDDFFDNLDIVCAALDNVDARLYLDQRCLLYHKPMFESGTLGAKGHTQVVLPRMTENYGASRDPPEKSIPLCTLKSFPNRIEHTLQWAREYFEEIYKQTPENVNRYIIDTNEFVSYLQSQSNAKLDILQKVKQALDQRPQSYADCLMWARLQFEDLYNNNIQQLLYNLPLDKMSADNTPFW